MLSKGKVANFLHTIASIFLINIQCLRVMVDFLNLYLSTNHIGIVGLAEH